MKGIGVIAIILLLCTHLTFSYKILGVFPTLCKSHWIIGHSVMKTLAEAGHEVHVISPFPLKTSIENYHDIFLENHVDMEEISMFDTKDWTPIQMINFLSDIGEVYANSTLSHPNVQGLFKSNAQFDLVIVEVFWFESLYGLGARFDCPVIALSTFGTSKWTNDLTGAPMEYSYVPHNFVKYSHDMTFFERTLNMLVSQYENIFMNFIHYGRQRAIYQRFFKSVEKSFDEQIKQISLVFINHHFSFSSIRPITANMIEIGGIHVSPSSQLPQDIQEFLDSAVDGAIIFSMGSIIQAVDWPEQKRDAFIRAFAKLRHKVIWKYEDENLSVPDNVMLKKWLPQRDILAHPNIKLFISHGGLLGTTEAVVEGVPILGIPIYADQEMNMIQVEQFGTGKMIDFNEINEGMISETIRELLTNPKYQENADTIARRYNDRPQTIQETVVYWSEYIIRHPHFHSPAHRLNFIQLHLIDSYAFLASIIMIVSYAIFKFVSFLNGTISGRKLKMS